jgi:hypothetical protein
MFPVTQPTPILAPHRPLANPSTRAITRVDHHVLVNQAGQHLLQPA